MSATGFAVAVWKPAGLLASGSPFDPGNITQMQSQEEVAHAMRLFDYVNHRGGRVVLQAIEQPPHKFTTPLSIFEHALAHEAKVTALIDRLYEAAVQHKDYATQVFLQSAVGMPRNWEMGFGLRY